MVQILFPSRLHCSVPCFLPLLSMEKLRRAVNEIACTQNFSKLSPSRRALVPILFLSSSIYKLSLSIRTRLYCLGVFRKHRLPVPVISVGNLTWGGNGKTPMVEFMALWCSDSGISPLILSRGYAGGDEVKMLQRHLRGTSAKIGVGANRFMTALSFMEIYGHVDPCSSDKKVVNHFDDDSIGIAILDDGMQHLRLSRDLELVMINALMLWGNHRLIPLGSLREPLNALRRADIVVVHHADMVSEPALHGIHLMIQEIKDPLPVFFTRMAPSHFLKVEDIQTRVPLTAVQDKTMLCVSAIGSPDAFVKCVKKLGPLHVDRIDFSDHHLLQAKDVDMIKAKSQQLWDDYGLEPAIVVTEKDYDRDPEVLQKMYPFDVLVLCSQLQFLPRKGRSESEFKKLVKQILEVKIECLSNL